MSISLGRFQRWYSIWSTLQACGNDTRHETIARYARIVANRPSAELDTRLKNSCFMLLLFVIVVWCSSLAANNVEKPASLVWIGTIAGSSKCHHLVVARVAAWVANLWTIVGIG